MLRKLLRFAIDVLAAPLIWVFSLPALFCAMVYSGLRLNRLFHRIGLSGPVQIWLIPSRLRVTRRLMRQPYWVPLKAIKWGGRPAGGKQRMGEGYGRGLVFDGDWDREDKQGIEQYLSGYIYSQTVFQLCRDHRPFDQTDQYEELSSFVRRGLFGEWQARGCRTEQDIARYFDGLKKTFEQIKTAGYCTQNQLGSPRWYDEIKIFVDRNGELHKQQGAGHHRLAMAMIIGLPEIPVLIIGMHRDWVLRTQREIGEDVITSVDIRLRQWSTRNSKSDDCP